MTTDPRDQKSEPEFEQDLEAVRSAWSGLEKTEPPELLNQAVMNTARRELESQRKRRPLRWLGAFATATVVVLALTLVVQQDEQLNAPELEKTDGFMLDQAAPTARKKEADRDDSEFRLRQNAAPAAAPAIMASDNATLIMEEETSEAPLKLEKASSAIPEAEAWIERLLLLQETQQDEKLLQELTAFRQAYPDYVLPPALQD
jgi:hypothetical protein